MLLFDDFILPQELTGYVREALANFAVNQFTLARYLPDRPVDDLLYRFVAGGEGLTEAATFRGYDTASPIASRPGLTRVTGELPPISRKIRLNEHEYLRLLNRGGGQIQDAQREEIRAFFLTDADRMTRAVGARLEMARGEALHSGKVVLNENGIQATVDFGRRSGNSVTVGTLWSTTASADPLTDLLTASDDYLNVNGLRPARILLSTTALRYLLSNLSIRQIASATGVVPGRVNPMMLQDIFAAEGLPTFDVYDAQVTVNGSAQRILPTNKVVLLPEPGDPNDYQTSELGATLYGTTAEAYELDIVGEEAAGIVAAVYKEVDPVALWTKAAAIAVPVLANPNLSYTLTVA